MRKRELLINPHVKWATTASEAGRLKFLDGHGDKWPKLPHEGDVLTLPFIVDPLTGNPVPVRVVLLKKSRHIWGHQIVVVVMRSGQNH